MSENNVGNEAGKRKEQFDLHRELYDWADALVTSLVFVILLFALIVRIIGVDGSSMEPTLHDGDKVLLTDLFYTPARGDVVVFTKKGLDIDSLHGHTSRDAASASSGLRKFMPDYYSVEDQPLVKRVIATEGETIDIDFSTGEVAVDGETLNESYIYEKIRVSNEKPFSATVPEGCVFVMGDNRNNSLDSRSTMIGFVDKRYILGHVIARVYPFSDMSLIGS